MWGDLSVMLLILHWLVGRMKMHSKFLSWHECLNTINVDVNLGVNFGSWLVLTLCVRLMAFMGTIRINVNVIMFLLSVIVTLNQGPPRRKKYIYG